MKIATTLNFWIPSYSCDLEERCDAIKRCKDCGFEAADMGFGGCGVVSADSWKNDITIMREYADKVGLEFTQSHLPFYTPENLKKEDIIGDPVYFEEMLKRGIEASSIIGAKWAVYHPVDDFETDRSPEAAFKINYERISRVLDYAHKFNVGIAIENMQLHSGSKPLRRYCVTPEELCELADSFNDSKVGICWDTGHANLLGLDQCRSLRMIGKRLKAVHIQDNRGMRDDHLPPILGNIDWNAVMKTIKEIGYEGDLQFETCGPQIKYPREIKDEFARLHISIGKYLISLMNE